MIYIGVDAAKNKHDLCFYDSITKKKKFLKIKNRIEDFEKLEKIIKDKEVELGIESTGIYHLHFYNYFKKYKIRLLHPFQIKKFLQALNKQKTDQKDCESIALILSKAKDFIKESKNLNNPYKELKELTRYSSFIAEQSAKLQKRLLSQLYITMPEIESLYKKNQKLFFKIFLEYQNKEEIIKNEKKLKNQFEKYKNKIEEIVLILKRSIGINNSGIDKLIQEMVKMILVYEDKLQVIKKEIEEKLKNEESKQLESIPWIGTITLATILGEIGDFKRFETKKQLVSFFGIDPILVQSGKKKHTGRISKRGSSYARKILYLHAVRLLREPKYKEYYEKQKEKGKHPKNILIAISKKIIELIYTLYKTGESYKR